jgi:hypothetical protein
MLVEKIVGAITFKKGVYASVAADQAFTSNAWLIVMVVSVLNQLGNRAPDASHSIFRWLVSGVVLGVFGIGAFALAVYLVVWLAGAMFKVNVKFEQVARALGLAYIWRLVGFLAIITAISPFLGCLLGPIGFIAWLAGLAADLFAIKESTNMDWTGTIVIAIIATVVSLAILGFATFVFSVTGLFV